MAFIILSIIGIVLFYHSNKSLSLLDKLKKNGKERIGKIVSYESDDEGYKTPIIEYETLNGTIIKKKPSIYISSDLSKILSYKNNINTKIKIIYNKENHDEYIIKDEKESNYIVSIIMMFIGLILFFIGIYNLINM